LVCFGTLAAEQPAAWKAKNLNKSREFQEIQANPDLGTDSAISPGRWQGSTFLCLSRRMSMLVLARKLGCSVEILNPLAAVPL
jgi:hypothetical protein